MFELSLICPQDRIEALGDALEALDALSVGVEDADAQTDAEQALFGEPGMPPPGDGWQRSRVTALFAAEAGASEAASLIAAQPDLAGCSTATIRPVPDQDWVRLTQSQFAPVPVTDDFWIVPTWHEAPDAARTIMRLDPGLAFGTGTHPTTRMCLRWIAAAARQPGPASGLGRVLDYGCGSGILAIAAALHDAHPVWAVDIDEAALVATRTNAAANGVALQVGRPEDCVGRYQTVLANILATPLKVLAPLLWGRVAPGGRLVLAGILARQADELVEAYAPWCQLTVSDQEEGWILMTAQG
ncbi:MAG: 50S ribosomal protein L11 methyltransferase [Rhodoferax sp.]|nr:50S ribosomal protein L11 methyltransferase [Rhodoferax sp.]